MNLSIFAVFLAGVVSFLSPCVLPLVPGYVSMLSGIGVEQLKEGEGSTGHLFSSALAFVMGFSIVFITFGASASAVGSFLVRNRTLLAPIAGSLIVLFGLHLMGWLVKISVRVGLIIAGALIAIGVVLNLRSGSANHVVTPVQFYAVSLIFLIGPTLTRWLNRDVHLNNVGGNKPGIVSGFLMGFAFAFGWTPCIGPILAGVLAIAATRDTIGQGIMLLAFYSAGLAIPFLLTALGIGRFLRFYKNFRKHMHMVEVFSGVLLLLIGALVFGNQLTVISNHLGFFQPENWIPGAHNVTTTSAPAAASGPSISTAGLAAEPDVTFKDIQGNNVQLASLKGKVVLVNFWGTWCAPCREEIPMLIGMQQKYGGKGFTLLGVATNDELKDVIPFVHNTQFGVGGQQMTMNYPIVMGTDEIATDFGGLIGMPTTILITRDGKIAKKYIGSIMDTQAQVMKDVESVLGS
jgi:cytochrome c-type biogenesis protein